MAYVPAITLLALIDLQASCATVTNQRKLDVLSSALAVMLSFALTREVLTVFHELLSYRHLHATGARR